MTETLKHETGEAQIATGPAVAEPEAGRFEGAASTETLQGQATTTITPPPPGQTVVLRPQPGDILTLNANPADVRIAIEGNNVVLAFDLDGNGQPDSQVVLENLVALANSANPPALVVGGQAIAADALVGAAQALTSQDAGAPTLETAADAGTEGTGATKYDDNLGEVIDLLVAQGVIPPVFLQFGLIEREEIVLFEESNEPPVADPVLTPAERGELPADLVTALNEAGGAVIHSETVTIAGPNLPGSVQYVFFTLTEPSAVTITTDGPTIDPQIHLFIDDGSLDAADFLATDDDDGTPAGSFSNSVIDTGDEIGILPAGNYVVAVSDFSLDVAEAVSGLNGSTDLTGDVTVTIALQGPSPDSVVFFKQLNVDGSIGDDDSGVIADFGGADAETSLENLVFTLQSNPTFGQLILVTSGGDTSYLTPGDTYTSEDTVWWIATEAQIADFLAQPGAPEFLPNVDFLYSVTDEAGASATAPVTITLPPPQPPRTALGVFQDDCLNEDTESKLLFNASPTDGASKISQIVISGFPTGDAEDAWTVDAGSVDIFGYTLGTDYTTSYNALTGDLTITFTTANFALGEAIDGTVEVTPNPDSDVDRTLTIEATAINGAGSATDSESSVIPVDADADGEEGSASDDGDGFHLSVSASASDSDDDGSTFQPDEIGTLSITATFDDFTDGSETHTIVVKAPAGFTILGVVGDLPAGVTLTDNVGSVWTFDVETLNGLGSVTLDLQIQNASAQDGTADFEVLAVADETSTGDIECEDGGEGGIDPVPGDNVAVTEDTAAVTVAVVTPPTVALTLPERIECIEEDSTTSDGANQVAVTATPVGDDEVTQIVISGLQNDWTYDFSGLEVDGASLTDNDPSDGSIILSVPNLASYSGSFAVQPPTDSDVDHPTIMATATVVDPVDPALTADGNGTIDIHVDANADPVTVAISVSDSADGDGVFGPGETGSVTVSATFGDFEDGSETHTVTVFLPTGFSYDAASVTGIPTGTTVDSSDPTKIVFAVPTDSTNGTGSFSASFEVTNDSAGDGDHVFEAEAKAVETTTGDEECDTSEADNVATQDDEDTATVAAIAPPTVALSLPNGVDCIEEDSQTSDADNVVTLTVTPDGDDEITEIVLSGFQSGWTYDLAGLDTDGGGAGVTVTDNGDGTVTIAFSPATNTPYSGSFAVEPPADSDVDHPTITATATVVDPADAALTTSGNGTLDIHVDANADAGPGATGGTDDGDTDVLSISIDAIADSGDTGSSFQTGESGTVTVTATFDDYQDGSETHSFTLTAPAGFEIDGINTASLPLPTGVTFDLALDGSSITFSMPTDAVDGLDSLAVTLDVTNVSAAEGSPLFTASATASETTTGDEECDTTEADNIATVSDEQSVTVAGVASPTVSINLENDATYIKEDSLDNLVQFSATTGDASDELTTVVITFPTGVDASEVDFTTVAADSDVSNVDVDDNGGAGPVVVTITFDPGVTTFSGSFTLDAPVADSDVDLGSISIVANVQDQVDNGLTDTGNASLQIDVDAVLDDALDPGLDSNVVETEIAAAQTIGLGLNASLISAGFLNDPQPGGDSGSGGADGDGSELISAVLVLDNALPVGVTLSSTAGTVTQDLVNDPSGLTYVISGADLETAIDGLEVNLPGSFQGTISGTVTVTSKEANTPPGDVLPASGEEPDTEDNVKVLNADFSVTINDGADPSGNSLNLTVDERALDLAQDGSDLQAGTTFGTNAGSTAETDSGNLVFDAGADPIVNIDFGDTAGIVVEDEDGNPIPVVWSGSGSDTLTGTLNGVVVIVLSLTGDNTAVAGGTANVTVTATLTDAFPHDVGNSGNVSISGIEVDAGDDDGDTGTGTVNVTVLDDAPNDISPDKAVIGSNGSFPVVVTEDLDFFDNVGADKPGDVTFLASLDGTALEDSGGDPVTSDGQPILLALSVDGHTLTGYVESGANTGFQPGEDTVILTALLNPDATDESADEYSITLSGPVDTGQQFGFDDFSGIGGGQAEFFPLSSSTNPGLMQDLLITSTVPGTSSVNTDNDDVGTGDQWLDNDTTPATGEILRLDYVTNVGGNEDDISTLTYGTHYTVNDTGFRINQLQGNKATTRTVLVRVYDEDDDPEGNDFATDGAGDPAEQDDITQVRITFFSGGILREIVATADGPLSAFGRNFTFSFVGDAVVIAGLLEGDQVFVSTLDGFNQMEIQNTTSGNSLGIALDNFLVSTSQAGEPIDLSLGIEVTDQDGDTSTGTIDVTVLPQQVGTAGADSLAATASGSDLVGGAGNDTLAGSIANDKLQGGDDADTIDDGDGNDIVIGGDGADIVSLVADGDTDVLAYDSLAEAGDSATGFDTDAPSLGGAGGDIIDLVDLMDSGTDFAGTTLAEAQGQGYVQLFQSGADTEVRIDVNGGGDNFSILVVALINTTAVDLNDNIIVD